MAIQKGMHRSTIRGLIELGPTVAERVALETKPNKWTISGYVMTHGAEHAWEAINCQLGASAGALFWIGGAAGTGKTHFLNYVLALEARAGAADAVTGRRLSVGVEIGQRIGTADLDRELPDSIAQQLEANSAAMLWREMRGIDALNAALEQCRRLGVRSITAAIDFDVSESEPSFGYLAQLAEAAAASEHPRLTVLVAARGRSLDNVPAFDMGPSGPAEEQTVALGRARRFGNEVAHLVDPFYEGVDTGGANPRRIFPFHPLSLDLLRALASPPGGIAALAGLIREVLSSCPVESRLIFPSDLMEISEIAGRVEARLTESGRAALKIAYGVLGSLAEVDRRAARQVIDTLMLDYLVGHSPALSIDELRTRVPGFADESSKAARKTSALAQLLGAIKARTQGVIVLAKNKVSFDPHAAGAPEVGAFNSALALIRKFDSMLTPARELPELKAKTKRLGDAMANVLEVAHRTRDVLAGALAEVNSSLASEQLKTLADFSALAEAGPSALVETGADPVRREKALAVVSAYEDLARTAAAVPRMRTMREYLRATGLGFKISEERSRERTLTALETECQLLAVAAAPGIVPAAARNIDVLEARFQKFKCTYVQHYRTAHAQWQVEIERLARIADDARRHLEALRRLNSISALGDPEGEELAARMAEVGERIVPCDFDGRLTPEINPRCPRCGFVLGTPLPKKELVEIFERIRRALAIKLAILSQSTIARLIREHDRAHRLDGFLKITQAAQTEALVQVLDDKLTHYLASLLAENIEEQGYGLPMQEVVRRLGGTRLKGRASELRASAPDDATAKPPHHDGR